MNTLGELLSGTVQPSLVEHLSDANPARFATLARRLKDELAVADDVSVWFASAPGRTELAGNHTDHNHGKVLAASINLDSIAAVAPRNDGIVRIASEGFPGLEISIESLHPVQGEQETTASLVRGVAAGLMDRGYSIGGFDATVSSRVLAGSGLSSSASIEVLLGIIFSGLFNDGRIDSTTIAQIGQYAENTYFGKPSGLMDQLACATGGAVAIDFRDNASPQIDRIEIAFSDWGLSLLVVDTGANHADLTDEYAAIPEDMKRIATALGGEVLADVSESEFVRRLPELRGSHGDRAVARGLHFFDENRRVEQMVASLKGGDQREYLGLMADSGRSSGLSLQNCVPSSTSSEQGVVVALALTERYFLERGLRNGADAAARVHGGGFAGTIQVLLPSDEVSGYTHAIETHLGPDAVSLLDIRKTGAIAFPA